MAFLDLKFGYFVHDRYFGMKFYFFNTALKCYLSQLLDFSGALLNVSPKEDDTAQALPGPHLPLPGTQSKTEHNISLILWSV